MAGAEAFCRQRIYLLTARKQGQSAFTVLSIALHQNNPWIPAVPATPANQLSNHPRWTGFRQPRPCAARTSTRYLVPRGETDSHGAADDNDVTLLFIMNKAFDIHFVQPGETQLALT